MPPEDYDVPLFDMDEFEADMENRAEGLFIPVVVYPWLSSDENEEKGECDE